MRKFVLTLAVAAAAALSLSACDSIDLTKQNDTAPATTEAEAPADGGADAGGAAAPATTEAAAPPSPTNVVGVKVADSAGLGKIVTDWKGWTLYRFEKDAPKPSKATCYDACAKQWPAVAYVEGQKIQGVAENLIGKVARTDGTLQLTINGWPAYRYAGDAKIGETKGQGVSGVWYAFTPEGKKAQAVAADNGGGGY